MQAANRIFILSGPVHSGKTTQLNNWIQSKNDVFGILTPVIKGKRFFMNAASKEIFPMESSSSKSVEGEELTVGKYKFSATAFNHAIKILQTAMHHNNGWLIVDEIGPLELNKKGFYPVLMEILKLQNTNMKIILVIRELLLEDVIKFLEIDKYELFKFE
jgi:nucleoside-triphosphatase THEP1